MTTKVTLTPTKVKQDYANSIKKANDLLESTLPKEFTEDQLYNTYPDRTTAFDNLHQVIRFGLIEPVFDGPQNKTFRIQIEPLKRIGSIRKTLTLYQSTIVVLDTNLKKIHLDKNEIEEAIKLSQMILKHTT